MPALPTDFAEALKENGLHEFFLDCTGPHQREYLKWISEAKRPEARQKRIQQAMKMISTKRREESARLRK